MNSILRKVENRDSTLWREHTRNSRDALGTEKGDLEAIWRHCPKSELDERNPCASGFEEQPLEETSRQAGCASKVAWNFGEKICKLKPKTTTLHPLVKAPETQKILYLFWIRDFQCSMLSKGVSSSNPMDTFRRSKNFMSDLPRSGTVQINEKAQVFVHDLDLLKTVQLLDEMPATPLLHKLCSKR